MKQDETASAAKWIWYPGDFEIYLGLKVHSSRYERTTQITPIWRMDTVYPNVKFRKRFTAEEDEVIFIYADGTAAVELDEPGVYCHDYQNGLPVGKGEHTLTVTVFNKETLPSIFIDARVLVTDETWEVTCVDTHWQNADGWKFCSKEYPPSAFRLDTKPVGCLSSKPYGQGMLYDFGKELMGYVVLSGVQGEGEVLISYGESAAEALSFETNELIDIVTVRGDITTDIPKAFRYLYIRCPEGLTVGRVSALYEYLNIVNKGAFQCDDPCINRIYDVSVYTLHLNSREFFLDGIKRDRWVWSGDACQSYLLNYYSFFDTDICKRTMRLIRGKDPVTTHCNTIQEYTLYWFMSLYDYYLYTGDSRFIRQNYRNAVSLMDFCFTRTDERGFLCAAEKDWVFVDWAPIDNTGDVSVIQILFARAIECMAHMALLCGDKPAYEAYTRRFNTLLPAVFRCFWSDRYHCFTHGVSSAEDAVVTKYPNMFAVLFGYLDRDRIESVKKNAFFHDGVPKIVTPYMKFYEMSALCALGCQEDVGRFIREYWGGMLKCGATTF